MARFARQHDYRIGRALLCASVLVIVGLWLFPVGLLRYFGRDLANEVDSGVSVRQEWIRLIPAEALSGEDPGDVVRIRMTPAPVVSPVPDVMAPQDRHAWSFDPTTAWQQSSSEVSPLAPAIPDSVVRHAEFLHALRLGNMTAAFAMLDTTQAGRAHVQLAETDRWVSRTMGPVWHAQGRARRVADVWWRAVGEVEAEGSH
ncbi:hypothetical protein DRQ53_03330 [bacterium]|nr:MAG: hypothetical protein DRQ53_03330 [bacterium]